MTYIQRSCKEASPCIPWLSIIPTWRKENLFVETEGAYPLVSYDYNDLSNLTTSNLIAFDKINDKTQHASTEPASTASLTDVSETDLSGFEDFESNDLYTKDPKDNFKQPLESLVPPLTHEAPLLNISAALDYCQKISNLQSGKNIQIDGNEFDTERLDEETREFIGKELRGLAQKSFAMSKEHTLTLLKILANMNALDTMVLTCVLTQYYRQPLKIQDNHETILTLLEHPKINKQSDLVHAIISFGVKESHPTATKFSMYGLSKKLNSLQNNHPHINKSLSKMYVKMAPSAPSGGLLVSPNEQHLPILKKPLLALR